MHVLFIEPPKEFWFILGEYIPPPLGILTLAAYLESKKPGIEIEVLDCQAENLDWENLEKRIEQSNPDILASSGLSTCNAFTVLKTVEIAKKVNPDIEFLGAQSIKEAKLIIDKQKIDAFFIDIHLLDGSGLDFAYEIRENKKYYLTPIVILTSDPMHELDAYRKANCYAYIYKPYSKKKIPEVLRKILIE